jgi:hypothetical protein
MRLDSGVVSDEHISEMATFMGSYSSKLWGLDQAGCVWNTQHAGIAGTEQPANHQSAYLGQAAHR